MKKLRITKVEAKELLLKKRVYKKTKTAHYSYQNSLVRINISTDFGSMFPFQKQPPELFCKKGVLKNFAKFNGKNLCHNIFFMKLK